MEAVLGEVLSAVPLASDETLGAPEASGSFRDRGAAEPEAGAPSPMRAPLNGAAADRSQETACGIPTGPHSLHTILMDLDAADAFTLDERLRKVVRLEQRLDSKMGPPLLRVAEGRLYRPRHSNLGDYARERLGISPRKARALLRLERAAERHPRLRDAYRGGVLSWVQALALIPVVTLPGACSDKWLERAERVTVRRLEEDVGDAVVRYETDPAGFAESGGFPGEFPTVAHGQRSLDPSVGSEEVQTGAQRETATLVLVAPTDVARLLRATLATVRQRIERETGRTPTGGEALDAMFEHAFEAWGAARRVAPAFRVFQRDGWRCVVPGCRSYRNLQKHHIVFRSAGGSDEDENCVTLCAWHHLRGVHMGRVRCRGRAPDSLRFELGLRAGHDPLVSYLSGDVVVSGTSPSARSITSGS
jgi:hypothetical protein